MTTREKAIQIFKSAIAAVQPALLVPAHLSFRHNLLKIFDQQFLLDDLQKVYVIGAGKASAAMAKMVEEILVDRITAGIVVTKYGHSLPLQKILCSEAAHPIPDEQGVAATTKTIELLQRAGNNDIIICLISGGASSLWIDLPPGASLMDVQETYQLLINCGATIDEVNVIRKHLSAIKGGRLLKHAPQSHWFSFIVSDVPGDRLETIASGPTVPGNSTFVDVNSILEKYALRDQLPVPILQHINDGITGLLNETPGPEDLIFNKVYSKIIGSNSRALEAAAATAAALGYHIPFIDSSLNGDAATVGREFTRTCKKYTGIQPACFLLGGETTVIVKGTGKGGRNQQMALSALCEMSKNDEPDLKNVITFLAAGTDGTDGPTDAAGAIADIEILGKAKEFQLDPNKYLENNDAYHFFEKLDSLVKTGATQTNVMDLVVVIIE